ncbi:hypothetical protein JCM11641_003425 [Rhodosporidiobolus odoratus]
MLDRNCGILTPYLALDQASLLSTDMDRYIGTAAREKIVRDVAESALTLLKNVRPEDDSRGLPLNNPKDLTLAGSAAAPAHCGMLNNFAPIYAPSPYAIDPLAGIRPRGGSKEERPVIVDGYYSDDPTAGYADSHNPARGNASFLDIKLALGSPAVVFVSAISMESADRPDLKLANGGNELISYVSDRHNDTIIVVTAPGPVDMSAWVDHANVSSILFVYFPTIEGGNAIPSVLFCDVSPSGKLPFAIAENVEDYPDAIYNGSVTINPIANFTEGVFTDYKYFDAKNITPLYEFGYGMSYTDFSFSDVKISSTKRVSPAPNTGSVGGAEVAQLYLTFPDTTPRAMPVLSLRGSEKPFLEAGESKTVSFELRDKDLAYYRRQRWF